MKDRQDGEAKSAMASETRSTQATHTRSTSGLLRQLSEMLRNLARALFDPYRPELHYMRGPGPKWRGRHAPRPFPIPAGVLASARVVPDLASRRRRRDTTFSDHL